MAHINRRTMLQFSAGAGLSAATLNGAQAHEHQVSTTAEALDSLAPRMRMAGVPMADIEAVRSRAPALSQWTEAWSEIGARHVAAAQELLTEGYVQPAGERYQRASLAYHFGRLIPADDAALALRAEELAARAGADALTLLDPDHRAVAATAVLRYPAYAEGPAPLAVLVAEGNASKEELAGRASALLDRGVACVTVDADRKSALADLLRETVADDPRIDLARVTIRRGTAERLVAQI